MKFIEEILFIYFISLAFIHPVILLCLFLFNFIHPNLFWFSIGFFHCIIISGILINIYEKFEDNDVRLYF